MFALSFRTQTCLFYICKFPVLSHQIPKLAQRKCQRKRTSNFFPPFPWKKNLSLLICELEVLEIYGGSFLASLSIIQNAKAFFFLSLQKGSLRLFPSFLLSSPLQKGTGDLWWLLSLLLRMSLVLIADILSPSIHPYIHTYYIHTHTYICILYIYTYTRVCMHVCVYMCVYIGKDVY